MAGHLFISRGDLTTLSCDAWLLPCDESVGVTRTWRARLSEVDRVAVESFYSSGSVPLPPNWSNTGLRVIDLGESEHRHAPRPYLVNVGGWTGVDPDWYLEAVRQWISIAASDLASGSRFTQRAKPLIGLPLIGTGFGGAHGIKGHIVQALVGELEQAAIEHDIDIVLMSNSAPAFAAAQHARRQLPASQSHPELSPELLDHVHRLAELAADDRLVLFIGAGVSVGAGLPSWNTLLQDLATAAGMNESERTALREHPQLDQARIIQNRLGGDPEALREAIRARLSTRFHALAHSLLAMLPIDEVVTLNYDNLFEMASRAAGHRIAVLPWETLGERERWLLKLHGSMSHDPPDIVLTREDFIRYGDRRAALTGIVQALLITRHMLFVGFSLTDDNFHRIVDDVRKAIRGTDDDLGEPGRFGSALFLRENRLLEELWSDNLHMISMTATAANGQDVSSEPARRLDVLLDALLAEASMKHPPLLDPAFDGVLTDDEREIRDLLHQLDASASDAARQSPSWRPIQELLTRMGLA